MTLRAKLTYTSIALAVLTYLLAALGVGIAFWAKAETDAKQEIATAIQLIRADLRTQQERYQAQALRLVREEIRLSQNVWFLTTANTEADRIGTAYTTTIRELTLTLLHRARLAAFDRIALFQPQGKLLILAEREIPGEAASVGYAVTQADGAEQFYQAQPQDDGAFAWAPAANAKLATQHAPFDSVLSASYIRLNEKLALHAVVPITHPDYTTGAQTLVGVFTATTRIDPEYAQALALLSRLDVNLFVRQRFLAGTLPAYAQPETGNPPFGETVIQGMAYYVGLFPVTSAPGEEIGSIGVLLAKAKAFAPLKAMLLALLVVGIAVIGAAAAAISFYAERRFARPLARLTESMQRLAEGGGLTYRVDAELPGEIGALARWFDVFLAKLRETGAEIGRLTESVTAAAQQWPRTAAAMLETAASQAAAVAKIAGVVQGMGPSIEENRAMAAEQAALVTETSQSAADVVDSIQRNTANAETQLQQARHVRDFLKKMSNTSKQVSQHAVRAASLAAETASAVTEMNQAAHEISNTTHTQVESTKKAAELVTNMAQTSSAARAKAHDAVALAQAALAAASNGQQAVNQTVAGMNAITESSEHISDIMEVISDIAEQTDLLALNAAIEAARAGQQGVGFGVVADEVRKLAERVGHSSKEITRLIHASNKRVHQGSLLVHEAYTALDTIFTNVSRTVEQIKELATASEEQEHHSAIVVETITRVENLAILIERATSQQVTAVEEILRTMESLAVLADEITTQTNAQAQDGAQGETIMTALAELSVHIQAATRQQVSGTTQAVALITQIAEKARQIVAKTAEQRERSQQVFAEIHHLEAMAQQHAQTLQQAQQGAQELVQAGEALRRLALRFHG